MFQSLIHQGKIASGHFIKIRSPRSDDLFQSLIHQGKIASRLFRLEGEAPEIAVFQSLIHQGKIARVIPLRFFVAPFSGRRFNPLFIREKLQARHGRNVSLLQLGNRFNPLFIREKLQGRRNSAAAWF